MKGILTRYTRSMCLSKGAEQATIADAGHPPAHNEGLSRSDADASLDVGMMTSVELEDAAKRQGKHDLCRHELAGKEAQLYLLHRQIEGGPEMLPL